MDAFPQNDPKSAVVLVIDRLGAGHLGPWGNTWLQTPQFNRLAAQSLVCETTLADSPDLSSALRAFWTGRHALEPPAEQSPSLPARAREQGAQSLLITDERLVSEHPLAADFGDQVFVEPAGAGGCAARLEETGLF